MGKPGLNAEKGLLLHPCRSIHTFFMRFALDLVFLNHENKVVKIVRSVKPGRIIWGGWSAQSVIEVQSGWLPMLQRGDHLTIKGA